MDLAAIPAHIPRRRVVEDENAAPPARDGAFHAAKQAAAHTPVSLGDDLRQLKTLLLFLASAAISVAAGSRILSPVSATDGVAIVYVPAAILAALYLLSGGRVRNIAAVALGYVAGGAAFLSENRTGGAILLLLEVFEPLVVIWLSHLYLRRLKPPDLSRTILFYCFAAVVVAALFSIGVVVPHAAGADAVRAVEIGAMWALSHQIAYLAIAPFLLCLIIKAENRSVAEALERRAEISAYVVLTTGVILFALFGPHATTGQVLSAFAPWVLMLLAPGYIFAAYRTGGLVASFLMAYTVLLISILTAMQLGALASVSANHLRLVMAIGALCALMFLGYVSLLNNALENAQTAIADKNRFLASIGHELRSSLTGVVGAAELLQKELPRGADPHDRLGLIQRTGFLMSRLVEDAVEYSQIGEEGIELAPIDFSLADAARDSAEIFKARLEEKGVALKLDVGDFEATPLHADASRIQQVMINLMSNAAKFTERGEVCMTLRGKPLNHQFIVCEIEVADTGPGVPPDKKRVIFEAFARAEPDAGGGLGLGLAISRDIALAMKGSVAVFDREGGGAVFRFKFVAERAHEVFAGVAPAIAPTGAPTDATTGGEVFSVLVAEDNHANRAILEAMLKAAGLRVTTVDNGVEAMKALRRAAFDLVLMDMHMPLMSGPDAIAEIRKLENGGARTPVIVVSGEEDKAARARLAQFGALRFVSKPFSADSLISAVSAALADAPANGSTSGEQGAGLHSGTAPRQNEKYTSSSTSTQS